MQTIVGPFLGFLETGQNSLKAMDEIWGRCNSYFGG